MNEFPQSPIQLTQELIDALNEGDEKAIAWVAERLAVEVPSEQSSFGERLETPHPVPMNWDDVQYIQETGELSTSLIERLQVHTEYFLGEDPENLEVTGPIPIPLEQDDIEYIQKTGTISASLTERIQEHTQQFEDEVIDKPDEKDTPSQDDVELDG